MILSFKNLQSTPLVGAEDKPNTEIYITHWYSRTLQGCKPPGQSLHITPPIGCRIQKQHQKCTVMATSKFQQPDILQDATAVYLAHWHTTTAAKYIKQSSFFFF